MNKKGFTLIELLAVLVVLAILALISIPITIRIINNSRDNANKRSVDGYGKAIELAIVLYQSDHNKSPNDIKDLNVNSTGHVDCETKIITSDGRVFLSKCKINNTYVMDNKTNDGYYHYGDLNTAEEILISKGNTNTSLTYENGNKHELYAFSEPKTLQTEAGIDYRFIGNVPNNYIYFNDELWRIIGVFPTEDENGNISNSIKIMRDESIGNKVWHSSNIADWFSADINLFLNNEYYNSLSSSSRQLIKKVKYYLGGIANFRSGAESYLNERGNRLSTSNSKEYWFGYIGLMYASDILYTYSKEIDYTCENVPYECNETSPTSSWVYNGSSQWTMTTDIDRDYVYNLDHSGIYYNYYTALYARNQYGVRPVLYLNDIYIASGNGSYDSPYRIVQPK